MIIVTAKFTAKPGMREKIVELSQKAIELTRKEEGCISYTLLKSSDDDKTLMYYEEWESLDALRVHLKADHILEAREARKDLIEGAPEVRIFEARETYI
ncbi:MAG: putative quinol monooxygenase [Aminivibrio sp.]|jgi:quinol monooxygenase YgiN